MDITLNVNISAPELSSALNNLATAIGGKAIPTLALDTKKDKQKDKKQTAKESEPPHIPAEDVSQPENDTPETAPEESSGEITLLDVRTKFTELTRAGKPVKALINKFGAAKLSEVPPEKFAELLKEAESL